MAEAFPTGYSVQRVWVHLIAQWVAVCVKCHSNEYNFVFAQEEAHAKELPICHRTLTAVESKWAAAFQINLQRAKHRGTYYRRDLTSSANSSPAGVAQHCPVAARRNPRRETGRAPCVQLFGGGRGCATPQRRFFLASCFLGLEASYKMQPRTAAAPTT